MSSPRIAGARGALSIALLASGAAVLGGCSSNSTANTNSNADSNTNSPLSGVGATRAAGATGAGGLTGASSTAYVLKAPSSIAGWSLTTPTAAVEAKMQQGLSQAEQTVGGVSGTPVTGLYDDTTDQAWVVFVGVNGSGLDPTRLEQAALAAPVSTMDAIGDRLTTTWVPGVSGGPHTGAAECQETEMVQAGLSTYAATGLAAEGAACFWMTPTTFGVVTIYPQQNSTNWDFGYSGKQMDAFMLKVRAAAELVG